MIAPRLCELASEYRRRDEQLAILGRTPPDLAVVGVDDIAAARLVEPALTTVTTDQAAVSAHLAATVVAAINGRPAPHTAPAAPVEIVARESA